MDTDIIQLNQSYSLYSSNLNYYLNRPSSWTHWTSSSSMATSILLTLLLIRSVLSTFVDEIFVMIVTLMLSTTCLHSLLSTSTLMPTLILSPLVLSAALAVVPPCNVCLTRRSAQNVYLPTQFGWCDIDSSTRSRSMSATKRIDTPTILSVLTNLTLPSSMVMSVQGVLVNWCFQLLYSRCRTILHTTVYFLGQNRASDDDDDDSGAINGSRCHTCLQYLTDKTFCLERMMLAYMFWLVRHLSFRTAIGTAIDVQVGTMGGLSSYITTWLLNPGGFHFIAQRNCIGLLL